VLIADQVAVLADAAFASSTPDFATAWIGAIAYTIQIYFDFSGYSDMAIGLGMMFGIRFQENFKHPYAATHITEFWRRWHISLSTWFRDYLYIPLGGNRAGLSRTYINLAIVFVATGLWHGAEWTFLLWGIWHGSFIILERILLQSGKTNFVGFAYRFFYFFPAVIFGWVLFRAENFSAFTTFSSSMLNPFSSFAWKPSNEMIVALAPINTIAFGIGIISILLQGKAPIMGLWITGISEKKTYIALQTAFAISAIVGCWLIILPSEFSPFLYFRF
jgi:alginate O-acetyltransferase complex protein AlgI